MNTKKVIGFIATEKDIKKIEDLKKTLKDYVITKNITNSDVLRLALDELHEKYSK